MYSEIIIETKYEKEYIKKSAYLGNGQNKREYWFKVPQEYENMLTDRADPMVYALIFPMMRIGGKFIISGADVSKSLIDNLTVFTRIWNKLFPGEYKKIEIVANEVPDDYRPNETDAIMAFSGGLDASYSLYKYKTNQDNRFKINITHAVIFLGADVPLDDTKSFTDVFNNAKKMTDDLNVTLVPIKTNIPRSTYNWSLEYMPVIVGGLALFSKKFAKCIIASADSVCRFNRLSGSNTTTDPWLSCDNFRVISDGLEHNRTERAAVVKDWDVGMQNLRVCWRNLDKSKNCGVCEKCIRTKLNFWVNGCTHMPTMPNDLTFTELKNVKFDSAVQLLYFQETYQSYRDKLPKDWARQLRKKIKKWNRHFGPRVHSHSFWWHLIRMKF